MNFSLKFQAPVDSRKTHLENTAIIARNFVPAQNHFSLPPGSLAV